MYVLLPVLSLFICLLVFFLFASIAGHRASMQPEVRSRIDEIAAMITPSNLPIGPVSRTPGSDTEGRSREEMKKRVRNRDRRD